ncbi:MAG TPA: ABC transporter substrate-binding protein [Alphaproteobacteria bacterium]|nr:ABC transporter substrate-binding protein [Alphaproteobacteria bacterium]
MPLTVAAQERIPKVGLLRTNAPPDPFVEAFRDGMRALGHIEGRTVVYEARWAKGRPDALPALAAELAALKVDVILTGGETAIRAAKQAAPMTPIVMGASNDPVAAGLAQSLAKPGGTVTGLTIFSHELSQKRLEVFREALPDLSRVALLVNPSFPTAQVEVEATEQAARALGLVLTPVPISREEDFAAAIGPLRDRGVNGLITLADPFFTAHRNRIATLARTARLPAMFHWPEFVEAGGLMSYGPDNADLYRRAATYVDRILRGATPGELPIERPSKLLLAVNLTTAQALGITFSSSFLSRADEVIE